MPEEKVRPEPSTASSRGPVVAAADVARPAPVPRRLALRVRNTTTLPVPNRSEALGYARFSTSGQREDSIERQVDAIREVAAMKEMALIDIFIDREVSGASSDREGLTAMLDLLRQAASRPATVIIESADRLARDTRIFVVLWDELKKLGVALHDVRHGAIDSDLKAALLGAISAEERASILYRTQRGREAHAVKGLVMSGVAFGYRTVPGEPGERAVCPPASIHVRRMFAMRAAGASLRQIGRELQDGGVRINDKQRLWHPVTIKAILSNPVYCGVYTYGRRKAFRNDLGQVVMRDRSSEEVIQAPVEHLRIVDDEVWDKVQALWRDHATANGEPYVATRFGKYLMQGKAKCHMCGEALKLVGSTKTDPVRRWRCISWVAGQSCGDPASYDMDVIERHIFSALGEILDRDDFERHCFGTAIAAIGEHNDRVRSQLEEVSSRLETVMARMQKSFDDGFSIGFSPERAAVLRGNLERQCTELEERQRRLRREFKTVPGDMSHLLTLRGALDGLAGQVPFLPTDVAGHALRDALRRVIGSVIVKTGPARDTMVIAIEFRFLPEGVSGEDGVVRVTRTHHLRRSEQSREDLRRRVIAAIEARTYAISEERWRELREQLTLFVAVRRRDGESMHRLLVEAIVVAVMTGADKSMVYRHMRERGSANLSTFGWLVQKGGGMEQLEEVSRNGKLPECGPLDLSAHRYHPRPNRRKSQSLA